MSAPKSSTEQQDPHVPRTLSEALVTEHVEELKESFEEVLDKIDVGPFHICLMLICGGSLSADAMEILLITFVQRKIMADLHIDIVQMSSLTSVVFLGMLLGAIAIGNFADHFGRKYALLFALLLNSVFGIATALSSSYPMLLLFRFFVGIGCGGIHVVYTYFLEFLPVKRCGRYHTVLTGFWTIGILLQCCLAYACRDYPWKVLVGVSATPCIFFFVCSIFIPESPRFLYVKKRTTELNTLMHRIARFNGVLRSVFPHDFTIQPFNAESHTEDDAPKISLMEHARYLLGSQNRTLTVVLWGIWFIIAEIYYGAILLAPSIKITNTEVIDIAVMSLSDIVGSMGTFLGVTVIGKEIAIMSGSLAVGFSILVLALDDIASSVYFACLFIARFTSCACLNTLFLYTPGAYPTKHRSTALGLCAAIARIAGSITPLIAQGLGDTNRPLAAVIYAVSSMICAALCKFLPEKSRMMQDTIE